MFFLAWYTIHILSYSSEEDCLSTTFNLYNISCALNKSQFKDQKKPGNMRNTVQFILSVLCYILCHSLLCSCVQCSYSQTIHPGVVKPLKSESLAELCGLMPYSFYGIFLLTVTIHTSKKCDKLPLQFPVCLSLSFFMFILYLQNFSLQKILHYMLSFFTWDSAFNNLQ